MKYVYPAIFQKDKEMEDTWCVEFPDVSGAVTCGYSLYEAMEMAEDALAGMLTLWEDSKAKGEPMNNRVNPPTPLNKIVAEPDEYSSEAFATLIKADTDAYRQALAQMKAAGAE